MAINPLDSLIIQNSVVAIVPNGTSQTVEQVTTTYGPDVAPALPVAGSDGDYPISAPWERIGRVGNVTPQTDTNTITVNGCGDNGRWFQEQVHTEVGNSMQITFVDISQRTLEFMFGLPAGALGNTLGGVPFSAGQSVKCWLYIRNADHRKDGQPLLHGRIYGELTLTTPPTTALEVANAVYTFTPQYNPEGTMVPLNLG